MKTQKEYMDELEEFKDRLGLNDIELAGELDVAPAMLSKWRTGKVAMRPKQRKKIIDFFLSHSKIEAIPEFEHKKCFLDKCPATPPVDRLLQYILESWDKLSPSAKGKIVSIVDEDKKGETCTDGHCLAKEA